MQKGDIIQRYRKNSNRSADFYVVLSINRDEYTKLLGFYKDGTPTNTYNIWHKNIEQMYRVVGHTDFIFDITKQIELITVDKKD